jgi:hypothetical protein
MFLNFCSFFHDFCSLFLNFCLVFVDFCLKILGFCSMFSYTHSSTHSFPFLHTRLWSILPPIPYAHAITTQRTRPNDPNECCWH